jgi:tRNA pseudouridine55 synthase
VNGAVRERADARGSVTLASSAGDWVLNVRKDKGWTSHDVVAKLRRVLRAKRVGHGGTLDPDAVGVLPVLVGRGTRIAEYLMEWDKEYRAVLRLGETTDTQDASGAVLVRRPADGLRERDVLAVLPRFEGDVRQTPPMFSAVKIKGVPLYREARAGRTVTREPRTVTVYRLECLGMTGRDVTLRVRCSKGTYVRTLCADIGEALGVGGHLLELERTRVGPLVVNEALTVTDIEALAAAGTVPERAWSLDQALAWLPAVAVGAASVRKIMHGARIPMGDAIGDARIPMPTWPAGQLVRLRDQRERLLAVGRWLADTEEGAGPARADAHAGYLAVEKLLIDPQAAEAV